MLTPEQANQFRVEEGGIDSERYVPLGAGPTIEQSRELCADKGHDWTPRPDEIWPNGIPESVPNVEDTYGNIVRCKRCGLSGGVALEYSGTLTPWFCSQCDDVYEATELSYNVSGWEDRPVCSECQEKVEGT